MPFAENVFDVFGSTSDSPIRQPSVFTLASVAMYSAIQIPNSAFTTWAFPVFEIVTLVDLYSPGLVANLKVKFCELAVVVIPLTKLVVPVTSNSPELMTAFSRYW